MSDPCEKERKELDDANKELTKHKGNPMDWEGNDQYKIALEKLEKNVREKEKTLEDCHSK